MIIITFFKTKLSKLHKKDTSLHVITILFLKQGQTRTIGGPITLTLKAYSLMLNRGRSQNFENLNFLNISVALLKEAPFPKELG